MTLHAIFFKREIGIRRDMQEQNNIFFPLQFVHEVLYIVELSRLWATTN